MVERCQDCINHSKVCIAGNECEYYCPRCDNK